VHALAAQAVEANRAYADGFGVRVRLEPAAQPAEVAADPDRLGQVMTNLLSNAIKFSPRDGEVTVATKPQGDTVRISVRDHGAGIPAEFKPRVFEKFAQADATDARQKGGTGLGLSIVKRIVTRLGGTIGFDDADGGGTVFHVDLPPWAQIARRELDAAAGRDALRILFCEDDPDAAMALREGLRPFGFATDFAHNPADAIARVRASCRSRPPRKQRPGCRRGSTASMSFSRPTIRSAATRPDKRSPASRNSAPTRSPWCRSSGRPARPAPTSCAART